MTLERSKVLPAGFYWVDVFQKQQAGFMQWLKDSAALVKVRRTVDHSSDPTPRQWFLFEVLFPVVWLPATEYGFPTKATKGTEEGDTVQRPDPEKDPLDKLGDTINADSIVSVLKWVAALGLGAFAISRFKK